MKNNKVNKENTNKEKKSQPNLTHEQSINMSYHSKGKMQKKSVKKKNCLVVDKLECYFFKSKSSS